MFRILGKQFRRPAGILGEFVSRYMIKGNIRSYEKVLRETDIRFGDHIFEIGYGLGTGVYQIARDHDCFVAGIDFSGMMYRKAIRLNREFIREGRVELRLGDFLLTEPEKDRYDIVLCLNVVYFWDNLPVPFAKAHSMLKSGGRFRMYMAHPDFLDEFRFTRNDIFRRHTAEEVAAALEKAGFEGTTWNFDPAKDKGYVITAFKPARAATGAVTM
jgi:SAM-dependent methyltransferase